MTRLINFHLHSSGKFEQPPASSKCCGSSPDSHFKIGTYYHAQCYHNLRWLPIAYRVRYKVLLLVYRVVKGIAPRYLLDFIHIHNIRLGLRSADSLILDVSKSRSASYKWRQGILNSWAQDVE